ncbi:hypothetical protein FRC10_011497 [Ceratobasidium sp. 414]|nr:hypothetical protein FRC10_011497 [Ceratobasidium sp. 414]
MVAPKELKDVHPLGLSPVITDGDIVLAESGAIVEYLIGKYGAGRFMPLEPGYVDNLYCAFPPTDAIDFCLITVLPYILDTHYAEGTLMPLLVNQLIFTVVPERAPFFIRPILNMVFGMLMSRMVYPRIKENMKMIEAHLAKRPGKFFAGGDVPTSADFQMVFPLEAFCAKSEAENVGEHVRAYVEAIHGR